MIKDLGGKWTLRQATGEDALSAARRKRDWLDAHVPGCVHTDLMATGRIPDPFYGLNSLEVQWVEAQDWLYSHSFNAPATMLRAERVELVCEGLDTYAAVFLNGERVGRADNMFCLWRWDVTRLLKKGRNRLLVLFQSPSRVGRELMEKRGRSCGSGDETARVYVRRMQCAAGWSSRPRLNTCGIWRSIYLHVYDAARIADVAAPVDWTDPRRPVIKLEVEVEALRAGDAALTAELEGQGSVQRAEFGGRVRKGSNVLKLDVPVENPKLWWPAGQGPQNLYDLKITGSVDEGPLEGKALKIGLRRLELRREKDEEGESFVICINGRPVFCKGANWLPADLFPSRLRRGDYDRLIRMAAGAGMNMLRVWGGGIYEADEFYEACDRLGVMVWQDFMFTSASYPDNLKWFMDSVGREAEQNVRRLRNHPSLVLWCGGSENHPPACVRAPRLQEQPGRKIYHELLRAVCSKLDPTRPYWRGSPSGGEDPNSRRAGDQHCWGVWRRWRPAEHYRGQEGRFISEFGLAGPPALETIPRYIPAAERHMQSRVMAHHNGACDGTARLYRYLASQFRVPAGFEDCLYLMQLAQGEAVKVGVEHWRARKFLTAGALLWHFNDCWPATSCSCIDSEGRPKALYYYARRFFAPVLPVVDYRDGRLSVTIVNDRPERFTGTFVCGMADLDGYDLWTEDVAARVPANGVRQVLAREGKELGFEDPVRQFVWCRLLEGQSVVSSNTHFFAPYMHVALPSVDWEVEVSKLGERSFELTLESTAFAKGVWLRLEGAGAQLEDNFFDALEAIPTTVRLSTDRDMEAEEVSRRLTIRTVADAR